MSRHLRYPLAAIAFSLTVAIGAATVLAEDGQPCDTRENAIAVLAGDYGETWRGGGFSSLEGVIYEVWASEATGSFTILKTTPEGWTCAIGGGYDWDDIAPLTPAPLRSPIPPPKPVRGREA